MSAKEEIDFLDVPQKEIYEILGLSKDVLQGLEESESKLSSPNILTNLIPLGLNGFGKGKIML